MMKMTIVAKKTMAWRAWPYDMCKWRRINDNIECEQWLLMTIIEMNKANENSNEEEEILMKEGRNEAERKLMTNRYSSW